MGACDDFQRAAEAAHRGLTRRQVIGRGAAAGLAVYAAKAMPLARILDAAEADAAAAPDAPVLVSVFLAGGCDLVDTLIPSHYGAYADIHPTLRVEEPLELAGTGLGINPALASGLGGGIKGLFEAGKVGFMPGIDYSNPDLSHFHSRHFWETGLITHRAGAGWLGRLLDHAGSPDNALQGISMSNSLSPALRTANAPVAAVSSPGNAQFWIPRVWGRAYESAMATYEKIAQRPATRPGERAAGLNAVRAKRVGDQLKPYEERGGVDPLASPVEYPDPDGNPLSGKLQVLAGLLAQPLGIRVAAVQAAGDYDTHDNQVQELPRALTRLSEALAAFQADLEARGLADRVLTFVWSEFGRRPHENDSDGTDHGAGGLAWVQGTPARPGILTDYPEIRGLREDQNLAVTVDFRRVYCSLLEQWMGADAAAVMPDAGSAGRLQVIA
jgi:uncharacterized protein (DUF1501 family)